ncbi:MAG TPA: hypothetical protein VH143_08570 [Kofleriaceae bacterium]|jgi:hypothetical protein|nr:hypothetical protein [Kofleriaceae bacterium]
MAETVKDSYELSALMPVMAYVLGRTTLQHIAVGAPRHRTAGAIG